MSTFQLLRIEIDQFQHYRRPLVVEGLEGGLNILAGHNEAGKSTLLRALRAALFDRYKSSVAERYRPHGAAVVPRVNLDFRLGDARYRLEKRFSRRRDGGLNLECDDGRRWQGPEAEEHLARLLGFSYPRKGASRPELQGVAGLLWVEQGSAHLPVELTDDHRRRVQSVFEKEMQTLLGGEGGEALLQRIRARHDRYFDKRGNPRGDYRKAQQRLQALTEQRDRAREALAAYEAKVDRLDELQRRLDEYRRERLVEKAQERLQGLQERARRVERLRTRIAEHEKEVAEQALAWEKADQAFEARQSRLETLESLRRQREEAGRRVADLQAQLGPLEETLQRLQDEMERLQQRRLDLQERLQRARAAQNRRRLARERDALQKRWQKAQALDEERRALQSSRRALAVTEQALEELVDLQRRLELKEERLGAMATRLTWRLEPGVRARLDDRPLAPQGEAHLTRAAELHLEGVGRLQIAPGSDELHEVRLARDRLRGQLHERLAALGVADLDQARREANQGRILEHEIQRLEAELKGLLGDDDLAGLDDRLRALEAQLDKLPPATASETDLESLEGQAQALEARLAEQQTELDEYRGAVSRLQSQLEMARDLERTERERLESHQARLAAERTLESDQALAERRRQSARRLEEAKEQQRKAQDALAAQAPDTLEREIERARRVLDDLQEERAGLERERDQLEAALDALGQRGLAEALYELEREWAQCQRALEEHHRQARALALLLGTLEESLQQARERVARPVVERLQGYLKRLLPDAEPVVDESLNLVGLRRGGHLESFESLSIGTREQLAVLVRLAYADLLADAQVPVLVILDDALVNADDDRRERMKSLLYQAAERYQILMLTCHGKEYRDAGGKFIRLVD